MFTRLRIPNLHSKLVEMIGGNEFASFPEIFSNNEFNPISIQPLYSPNHNTRKLNNNIGKECILLLMQRSIKLIITTLLTNFPHIGIIKLVKKIKKKIKKEVNFQPYLTPHKKNIQKFSFCIGNYTNNHNKLFSSSLNIMMFE